MKADLPAAVAGGGIVGLTAALLLNRRCGWEIGLVERWAPRTANGEAPQRALTLSPGAHRSLTECGVWGEGRDVACHEFSRMVVWWGRGPEPHNRIVFDAAELGVGSLGCVAREASIRRALWELAEESPDIRLHSGAALQSLEIGEECGVLRLDDGSAIAAELLVGADGAQSGFRQALGVGFESQAYGQTGVVFEAESESNAGDTAWQRFVDGGTLALLPLSANRWSIVWSMPDAQAQRLANLAAADLQTALNNASASVVGELVPVTAVASFPLRRGFAARISGERYALLGEAARIVHPLAGQGLNLGIGDADTLARVCAKQGSASTGDARVLGRFARERSRYGHEMSFGIHAINAAFAGPTAQFAACGMAAVDRLPLLKRRLAARAMR
ncbi:FAD-dependent monooxygenase [Candidatus Foliamicus sp.]